MTSRAMITASIKVGEDHAHINLLTRAKAHLEFILSTDISSRDAFLNGEFTPEDLLVSRTFLKTL